MNILNMEILLTVLIKHSSVTLEGKYQYCDSLFILKGCSIKNYTCRQESYSSLMNVCTLFHYDKLCQFTKPSPTNILDKAGNLIGQKVVQTWCLIQLLTLIIFDSVLANFHQKYNTLLQNQIFLLLVFSIISSLMANKLEGLMQTHHEVY